MRKGLSAPRAITLREMVGIIIFKQTLLAEKLNFNKQRENSGAIKSNSEIFLLSLLAYLLKWKVLKHFPTYVEKVRVEWALVENET